MHRFGALLSIAILFLQVISLGIPSPVSAQSNSRSANALRFNAFNPGWDKMDINILLGLLFRENDNKSRTAIIRVIKTKLDKFIAKSGKILDKIKSRKTKLAEQGVNTSSMEPWIAAVQTDLNLATTQKNEFLKVLNEINWNGDKTANRIKVRDEAKKLADAAKRLKNTIADALKQLRSITPKGGTR